MKGTAVFRWTLLSLLLLANSGYAESLIKSVSIYPKEQTLYVDVDSDIHLANAVSEAIQSGITLIFRYQFKISQQRWYPTQPIAAVHKSYELSYSRMTGKYYLDNPITFEREAFTNLSSAIGFMQKLRAFPLILVTQLPDEPLVVAVRFHLTTDNLPSYVRVERLFNKAWSADSEWTNWSIDDANFQP